MSIFWIREFDQVTCKTFFVLTKCFLIQKWFAPYFLIQWVAQIILYSLFSIESVIFESRNCLLSVFWGRESTNVHCMTFLELTKYFLNQGVICPMFSDSGSHYKLHYTTLYEPNSWFSNQEVICWWFSELDSQPKLLVRRF